MCNIYYLLSVVALAKFEVCLRTSRLNGVTTMPENLKLSPIFYAKPFLVDNRKKIESILKKSKISD